MRVPRISLLHFLAKSVIFFALVCAVWYFVAPTYNDVLARAASILSPSGTVIAAEHNTIYLTAAQGRSSAWMYAINGLDLQYGLVAIIALIAATPGLRVSQRLRYIPVALVFLFIMHILTVSIFARAIDFETSATAAQNPLVVLFGILGCDLFPLLVWGVLFLRHVRRPADSAPGHTHSSKTGVGLASG